MVYLFGFIGLILGFGVGLGVINVFLRNYSRKELQTDKGLWWTYGLAVWIFAGLGCWLGLLIFDRYF